MRDDLPAGTVTFLFTDVEGSTRLLHELGAEVYAAALAEHRRVIREACASEGGVEVDTQGDAFFFAFPTAPKALAAASAFTVSLSSGPIRVRVGLHTGTPLLTEEGYVGGDVHRAARIAACGHGDQVLVSSSTAQLVELELADLGEHRLKDLSAPERVFQLGDREFPTLKSLYRTNLPVPATPFLGRERELAEILALLSEDGVRLLTLTGPGGAGKTRLALQAAGGSADRYPDGVYWVPLAPLRDPALVLGEASQALAAQDGLAAHIADKELLLLFDNFEHVLAAAPGLAELLSACPNLSLLITSRELLALPGEQAYPVPPLAEEDGSELFLARARAADPGFRASVAVGELCAELEQLPLALELAAARVRVLTPEQLLERLSGRLDLLKAGRGVDPRQRTLRATIEWSYELLSEEERQLFARLACFRGGCTLDASEEICEANLDLLQSLVDKSLLRLNEGRFWMLETIREYAVERLEESGECDELRRRHAEWFLALAETAAPHLRSGTAQKEWLDRLDPEHDNVRAALDWLEASGEGELVLRLGAAFWRYWNLRGHFAEGARRLERALGADERPSVAGARALLGSAVLISATDNAKALRRIEEAGALSEQLGDVLGAAKAKFNLGALAVADGDYERGLRLLEASVEAFRSLGDEFFELQAALRLAWAYESLGDLERARALQEDCLSRARETGDRVTEGRLLGVLAGAATDDDRLPEAAAMLQEALGIHREIGNPFEIGIDVFRFARLRAAQGDWETAARLASAADARLEDIGASLRGYDPRWVDRSLTTMRTELGEGAFAREWSEGATLTVDEAIALALAEHEPDA